MRQAAAEALGQCPESERLLLSALNREPQAPIRAAMLVALGRQGRAASLRVLTDALETPGGLLDPAPEAAAAAHAIGRMALRGIDGVDRPEVVGGLLDQLQRPDLLLRQQVAFALARLRPTSLPPAQEALLFAAAVDEADAPTRAMLVRAAGAVQGAPEAVAAVLAAAAAHPDVGLRIAALRAGAGAGWTGVVGLLFDTEPAVRLQAIEAVGQVSGIDHRGILLPIVDAGATTAAAEALSHSHDTAVLEAAAAVQALVAAGVRLPPARVTELVAPAAPTPVRVAAVGALRSPPRLAALAVEDGELPVRTAAAAVLASRVGGDRSPPPGVFLPLLEAYDEQVVAIAADALATALADDDIEPVQGTRAALLTALRQSEAADPVAAILRALEAGYVRNPPPRGKKAPPALRAALPALGAHPAQPVRAAAAPLAARFGIALDPAPSPRSIVSLDGVEAVRSARIRTTRGDVLVALDPELAPLTVANFAQLAESGFYDGVIFHRVVADFVVQAGDPRGDGMGGPAWTIPDEVSARPYAEGTLGMALAGPDTGGSQWFITLSPQPHLDGDYTVFGHVLQGMHLLQGAHEGLRIRRIEIERAPSES